MKLWLRRDHQQPHAFAGEVIEGQGQLDGGDATTSDDHRQALGGVGMVVKVRDSCARGRRRAWPGSRGGSSLWTRRLGLVAVLSGLLSCVVFVLQGHGSRVTDSRPRGQQQHASV